MAAVRKAVGGPCRQAPKGRREEAVAEGRAALLRDRCNVVADRFCFFAGKYLSLHGTDHQEADGPVPERFAPTAFRHGTCRDNDPFVVFKPKLYIIAGCNGAGKTTASYTVLPEVLGCREFVNADEIAHGLSPFNPSSMAIEAGRLMLQRMNDLMRDGADFAFETTLATRSYVNFIELAHAHGYFVTLLYFWLPSPELAVERVASRVQQGGHHIPTDVVYRRYRNSLRNLTSLYTPVCDFWAIYDNNAADDKIRKIASGERDKIIRIEDPLVYQKIVNYERD